MRNNLSFKKHTVIVKLTFKVSINIPVIPCGGQILTDEQSVERITLSPDLSVCTLIKVRRDIAFLIKGDICKRC